MFHDLSPSKTKENCVRFASVQLLIVKCGAKISLALNRSFRNQVNQTLSSDQQCSIKCYFKSFPPIGFGAPQGMHHCLRCRDLFTAERREANTVFMVFEGLWSGNIDKMWIDTRFLAFFLKDIIRYYINITFQLSDSMYCSAIFTK